MSGLPGWLSRLEQRVEHVDPASFGRVPPPREGGRASAVLMLFAPDADGQDSVVLTQRTGHLRSHAGQVAFPGGRLDPHDDGPVAAALREANEEVGLESQDVQILGTLPDLFVPVSNSVVTSVVAWAAGPPPLWARSTREVESVWFVPLAQLLDPAHRLMATHRNGYRGPAFELPHLYVWGFTAALLSGVFELAGLERPWDRDRTKPLPSRYGRPMTSDDVRDSRAGEGRDSAAAGAAAPRVEANTTPTEPAPRSRTDLAGTP